MKIRSFEHLEGVLANKGFKAFTERATKDTLVVKIYRRPTQNKAVHFVLLLEFFENDHSHLPYREEREEFDTLQELVKYLDGKGYSKRIELFTNENEQQ